jgi:UDPglucose 6-dehydrogenase
MNIGFIGLGKLGLPCALAINSKGHNVWGFDIDLKVKDILETKQLPYREKGAPELLQNHSIIFDSVECVVNNADIIFVPIQTPHEYIYEGSTRIPKERDNFNYDALKLGIKSLSDQIEKQDKNKIVVIISTVLPGTIEKDILPIIKNNDKLKLCYNPFFIAMGTTIDDFLNSEFVLFGTDSNVVSNQIKEFYSTLHSRPFYQTSIKNAELIKVSYNTFIGMKIVFTNTIMEICHKIGANVDEVMGALKMSNERLISPKYLNGGMGDGGGCHPRDNIAMSWLANEIGLSYNFFDDIMMGREKQTEFLADLIMEHDGPYYILGKTFKEETNLLLGSPAILLSNILKEKNVDFTHYDPFIDNEVPNFKKGTYFIATRHQEFKLIDYPKNSTIIDVWRYLNIDDENINYVKVGNNE